MKSLVGLLVLLAAWSCLAAQIKLVWDPNDPAEEVTGYLVFEIKGTNYVKIAEVRTNEVALTVEPGLHIYTVKATNFWAESPFSNTARTPPVASAPKGQRAEKLIP